MIFAFIFYVFMHLIEFVSYRPYLKTPVLSFALSIILRHAWTAVWPVSEFEGEGQHIKEVKYGC